MANERRNSSFLHRARTAGLTATGQTDWLPLIGPGGHRFTANVEETVATVAGTFIVEAREALEDGTFGAVRPLFSSAALADFPQLGCLAGDWEVRLRCSAYTSGTWTGSVSQ